MQKPERINSNVFSVLMEAAEIMYHGVFWLNEQGRILGVNEIFVNQLGYTKNSFEIRTIFEVNPNTSFLSWKRLWKRLENEGQVYFETEQITVDESIYPVQMRAILLEIDGNKVCMAIVENLMQTSRFKDLLEITSEIAGIGSWEWNLVQNEITFTDEMFRLLDIPHRGKMDKGTVKELVEVMFKDGLSTEVYTDFRQKLSTCIQEGKAFESEFMLRIKGKYTNFLINIKPIWLEDKTIKVYGTLQNLEKISNRTDELYFTQYCMDFARDMVFWITKDGNISYVNNQVCALLGYSKEELTGQSSLILTKQAPFNHDWEAFWKAQELEGYPDIEVNFYTKDGKALPVSVSTNLISFKGSEINCSFVRNLSKKKQRDELITMAKYSLDQSIDMIFWLNPDATFRYFNDAFVKQVGFSRAKIEKMKIVDFFPGTTMADFEEGWAKLQQGAVLQNSDRTMRLKDGQIIPTEVTASMVKVGQKEYSSTVIRDISDRKQKEADLKNYIRQIEQLQQAAEAENVQLREEINLDSSFTNIISRDPNYKKVLHQVEQVADTEATVLILGETGTGKELLARAVHQLSRRADFPMVKVNCGSLPENLIESELFGHEKGAFTGAHQQKIGKFERADKGTIFLDEIGELPLDLQTQLLRVLQEGEIERVGGTKLINIDVRVVAATNRNLEKQVAEGKFREDLYYRLNVFPINNIPLRERREDIPILVKHFADKYSQKLNKQITEISQSGLNKLMAYDFLGNIRELENMVERAVILAKNKVLSIDLTIPSQKTAVSSRFKPMEEMQKDHIIDALRRTNGKVSGDDGAAYLLDMNDKTLTSRMKKLGIDKRDYLK